MIVDLYFRSTLMAERAKAELEPFFKTEGPFNTSQPINGRGVLLEVELPPTGTGLDGRPSPEILNRVIGIAQRYDGWAHHE